MAQQVWQSPSATAYDTLPAGVEKTYTLPTTTVVQPNQDFSFEFLFPDIITTAQVGTTANIYRSISPEASISANLEPIGSVTISSGDVGKPAAFIRDVFGLIARNVVVKVTPSAQIRIRVSAIGVTVNG